MLKRCLKYVSKTFPRCFKGVSRVLQGRFIGVSSVFDLRKFQAFFKEVSEVWQNGQDWSGLIRTGQD